MKGFGYFEEVDIFSFWPLRLVLWGQKSILTNVLFYTIFVLDHLIFALFLRLIFA